MRNSKLIFAVSWSLARAVAKLEAGLCEKKILRIVVSSRDVVHAISQRKQKNQN
jgi:hypothetical protein